MKVRLSEALLARLEMLAAEHYTTAAAFVHRIVADYCVASDRTAHQAQVTIPAAQPLQSTDLNRGASGYKGVYRSGRRWIACIVSNKQRKNLGTFDNPEDAARAYDNELVARTGDPNAACNFPTAQDQIMETAQPYLDKLTASSLSDAEWAAWLKTGGTASTPIASGPIVPPSDDSGREPLVAGRAVSLYRRGDATPGPRMDPMADPESD